MTARMIAARGLTWALIVWAVGAVVLVLVALFAPLVQQCPWERPRRFVAIRRRVGAHVHPERSWRMHDGPRGRPFRAVQP